MDLHFPPWPQSKIQDVYIAFIGHFEHQIVVGYSKHLFIFSFGPRFLGSFAIRLCTVIYKDIWQQWKYLQSITHTYTFSEHWY